MIHHLTFSPYISADGNVLRSSYRTNGILKHEPVAFTLATFSASLPALSGRDLQAVECVHNQVQTDGCGHLLRDDQCVDGLIYRCATSDIRFPLILSATEIIQQSIFQVFKKKAIYGVRLNI
jgi:hypothetical protein